MNDKKRAELSEKIKYFHELTKEEFEELQKTGIMGCGTGCMKKIVRFSFSPPHGRRARIV